LRSLIRKVTVLAIEIVAGTLRAQNGMSAAFVRVSSSRIFSSGLSGPSIVTADFNNVRHPDDTVLVLNRNAFRIELHSARTCRLRLTKKVEPARLLHSLAKRNGC
jgi:hypothetical protein